jgi:hypothetical protein
MNKKTTPGRPPKKDSEKKVQVIHYIPKMYAVKFKKAVEPYAKEYGTVVK